MTSGWPRIFCSVGAIARICWSVPPGAYGTITRIGFAGQSCAVAGDASANAAASTISPRAECMVLLLLLSGRPGVGDERRRDAVGARALRAPLEHVPPVERVRVGGQETLGRGGAGGRERAHRAAAQRIELDPRTGRHHDGADHRLADGS